MDFPFSTEVIAVEVLVLANIENSESRAHKKTLPFKGIV